MDEILTQFIELLIDQGEVDLKSIYIEGTKIESNVVKEYIEDNFEGAIVPSF